MKTYKSKTIQEALSELQTFLESDIWYAKDNEWKTEEDMVEYLRFHFDICRKQIKGLEDENN